MKGGKIAGQAVRVEYAFRSSLTRQLGRYCCLLPEIGLRLGAPSAAVIVVAHGDSMKDTIGDGDPIVCDTSARELRDKIYVFRRAGELVVKRVQRHGDGTISLISDNPAYREERLPHDESDQLEVIGRVGFVFRRL